jgi:hypothetical protein
MNDYIKGWNEQMSLEDTKNLAYWERNMLALTLALQINISHAARGIKPSCGWYVHGEYKGWARVISIDYGKITFHVPDNFDMGDLKEIEPNWDGHSTEAKWKYVKGLCGVNK